MRIRSWSGKSLTLLLCLMVMVTVASSTDRLQVSFRIAIPHTSSEIGTAFFRNTASEKAVSDSWLGRDKTYHFLACAAICGAGSAALQAAHNDDPTSFGIAFGVTLSLGIGKELWDKKHPGHQASWKDLAADAVGAVAGGFIAVALWAN